MQNVLLKLYFYNLSSHENKRNKRVTVTVLQNENDQNVITYSQIKKIENISFGEISNNCDLLIAHIILNKLVHISKR